MILIVTFAVASVEAPPVRADHNTEPWGVDQVLTGGPSLSNFTASTLDDGHGNLYVFYLYGTLSGNNLLVEKFQDAGPGGAPAAVATGFPSQVNTASNIVDFSQYNPEYIASSTIDHAGTLYVAWTHLASGASQQDVYVSKSTDGALTWPLNSLVSPATANVWDYSPSVVAAPNGTVYVAWIQVTNGFSNISVSYSSNGGSVWSAPRVVSELGAHNAYVSQPALAVDASGHVYLAYSRLVGSAIWINLTRSTNGVSWTAPVTLATTGAVAYEMPGLAVDSAGRVHVAWEDSRVSLTGIPLVYYTRSADGGASWTTALPISQGQARFCINGYVQLVTGGDLLFATWNGYSLGLPFRLSYAISPDNGASWYPEQNHTGTLNRAFAEPAVDQNGTVYVGIGEVTATNIRVVLSYWHSPPSRPVISSVSAGTGKLTVAWTAPPEADIAMYRVWRSNDGSTYTLVATLNAPASSYQDSGLANGTYWYRIEAVDAFGYISHASVSAWGTVGLTVEQLNAEIAALQSELANASSASQAQIAALQAQITTLQAQLTALQGTGAATAAEVAQLKQNLTNLQDQLNALQAQQATQTLSYANLAFDVVLLVLLVVVLLNQRRRPKTPGPATAPGQPKRPEDDL